MKTLMLKLEPVIWMLFSSGMMIGALLLPVFILVVALGGGFGVVGGEALGFDRMVALATHPIGTLIVLAAMALPLWGGAHHLRHLWIDLGGLKTDGLVGFLCYGTALAGSIVAILAVVRLHS
ncbi:MAG: fumarate reductase subunit D [bacterium]|nr:fumarate reductase subunit D [bacterium]MCP5071584.1 fumarate reductase subunit D [bacterium]